MGFTGGWGWGGVKCSELLKSMNIFLYKKCGILPLNCYFLIIFLKSPGGGGGGWSRVWCVWCEM